MGPKFPLILTTALLLNGAMYSFAQAEKEGPKPETDAQKFLADFKKEPGALGPATGSSRLPGAPASPKDSDEPKVVEKYFPQVDAFSQAAEQASFLGAYQQIYGPFGLTDPSQRDQLIKETALAIESCLKGSSKCNDQMQMKVITAMVHFNAGQEVKKMVLKNNTNRENMKSLEDDSPDARGKPKVNNEAIEQSLKKGETYEYNLDKTKAKPRPTKIAKDAEFETSKGISRKEIFQLDEGLVNDDAVKHAVAIKGTPDGDLADAVFSKEFGSLMNSDPEKSERFYKYVPAKNDENVTVIAKDVDHNSIVDQEKKARTLSEQNDPNIRKLVDPFLKKDSADFDTKRFANLPGDKLQIGKSQEAGEREGVNYDDLKENKELSPELLEAKKKVRNINDMFKKSAEGEGDGTLGSGDKNGKATRMVTLNVEDFDKFLDGIWPPAAARQAIVERVERSEAAAAERKANKNRNRR